MSKLQISFFLPLSSQRIKGRRENFATAKSERNADCKAAENCVILSTSGESLMPPALVRVRLAAVHRHLLHLLRAPGDTDGSRRRRDRSHHASNVSGAASLTSTVFAVALTLHFTE